LTDKETEPTAMSLTTWVQESDNLEDYANKSVPKIKKDPTMLSF